jgi:hypothetical protein
MFTSRTRRPAIICALACALLASAIGDAAAARANEQTRSAAALAQERYYSSYGEPEALSPRQSPVPSDDTPWLATALSVAVALAVVAASATQFRRLRVRRRAARVTT